MKAEVKMDQTTRTIELDVTDGAAVDVTESWNTKRREIQADRVLLRLVDEQVTSVVVRGRVIKKDGTPGENRASRTWRPGDYRPENRISAAPGWVREIAYQAPTGIRGYSWTEAELEKEARA
jgi:hypothetical protein